MATLTENGVIQEGANITENGLITFGVINRMTNIGRAYASDGTTLKQISQGSTGRGVASAADGDRAQLFFMCSGVETKLEISNRKLTTAGIWDLYINNVLDSSGYDDYAASAADVHREITLTQAIVSGLNVIELRVNGKNASSSAYNISVYGASLQ